MNLARIRKQRNLTQAQLAGAVGVTQPTISRAERATPDTKLATYYQIADVLGVTLAEGSFGDERTAEEERLLRTYRSLREGTRKLGWESLLRMVLDDVAEEAVQTGKDVDPLKLTAGWIRRARQRRHPRPCATSVAAKAMTLHGGQDRRVDAVDRQA